MFVKRFFLLATIVLVAHAPTAPAQSVEFLRSNPKFTEIFRDVVKPHVAATVRIQCDGKDTCLGVCVDADGWILTKANDLRGEIHCVLADGRTFAAKVVGVHEPYDLAMLKVSAQLPHVLTFAHAREAQAGTWVASVGVGPSPAAVGVVGVPTRKVNDAYLGIQIEDTVHGLVVQQILKNSGAERAGLRSQDILLNVNGMSVTDANRLQQILADLRPGDAISLKVRRGDRTEELKATLQSREQAGDFRSEFQNRLGSELSSRRSGYGIILQHDSVLRPIDCGGPLVDLKGRVIGINISRAGRVETFALPAEVVQPLLLDLRSGRLAPKLKE